MKSRFFLHCAIAALSLGVTAMASIAANPAHARGLFDDDDAWFGEGSGAQSRERHYGGTMDPKLIGRTPLVAVGAIRQQRMTVYDAQGKMLESPISSGTTGTETPPGIFSVVQKEEDHRSNLFDDARMPFMHRITWTGISLHIGVLPGYPASHGCVRLPEQFAYSLYQLSKPGMRVILVRDDITPAEIAQPAMFTSASAQAGGDPTNRLKNAVSQKSVEADAAIRRFKDAKAVAAKRAGEATAAERALKGAEAGLANAQAEQARAGKAAEAELAGAQAELNKAEKAAETAAPERAEQAQAAKAQAAARIEAVQTKIAAAKAQAAAKVEAAQAKVETAKSEVQDKATIQAQAEQDLRTASAETAAAHDAAETAKLDQFPISVFISRKTQRLYVRKNNLPVYEAPVIMRDADKPIGSFVFTALDYTGASGTMRWQVVSMYKDALNVEPAEFTPKGSVAKVSTAPAAPADVANAQAALARITVTPETQERLSSVLLPGASLIISDEGVHSETGKDTDFIVIMPGEPMGGLTSRNKPSSEKDWAAGFFGSFSSRGSERERGGRNGSGSRGGWLFSE